MASLITNKGKKNLIDQGWASRADVGFILVNDTVSVSSATNFLDEVTAAEVAGTGYARGTLANMTSTESDGDNWCSLDADDVVFSAIDVGADLCAGLILYDSTAGTDATREVIAFIEFTVAKRTNGEDFTIQFHADGVITVV